MSADSTMILLGLGTAGCSIARGIRRAFGEDLRYVLADTDAKSGEAGEPFVLLGGDRLSGRGAGGDVALARISAEESVGVLDEHLSGVRLAILVTALGGGTGGGATLAVLRHLSDMGIPALVFATTPFAFEGETRLQNAASVVPMIEEKAGASFVISLDRLVQGEDNVDAAFRRAIDVMAGGVTLFWRLVEKPGYIRLDAERLRHLLGVAGRGRFATVTVQGPSRAEEAVEQLSHSELLSGSASSVRAILCGVLAGEDLRLSEIGRLSDGLRKAFGWERTFELGTVNDETTFCGRMSVVVMLFEADAQSSSGGVARKPRMGKSTLSVGPTGRGRFNNAEPTVWHGEDLDVPTYLRRGLNLER